MEEDVHCAATRVIALENTLNGSIFSLDEIRRIGEYTRQHNLILHCDGARLWNASAETGIPLSEWCKPFQTVSLCLSKGIGAPVGSIMVGPKPIIKQARHYRKLFGGGWRQSGPLAAAALVGIQSVFLPSAHLGGRSQMQLDHENARWFAATLPARVKNMRVVNNVETNMVFVDVRHALEGLDVDKLVRACEVINNEREKKGAQASVRIASFGYAYDSPDKEPNLEDHSFVLRLVFHHSTPRKGCELLIQTFEEALHRLSKQ
jgi:threonine aldolase